MNNSLSLEYNSTRDKLLYSEYGRSVQKLVKYAKTVEDNAQRQAVIEEIVELINQLNPQTKNVLEYKQKLWRHVFKMADFDLDIEHPYGEKPTMEDINQKANKVPYPQHEFNWRHYGYNIRVMIEKALQMEDGLVKKGYVETILSYMKLSFRTWNQEHFVSDELIISDLVVLSKNRLFVDENHSIQVVTRGNQPTNTNSFKPEKKNKNNKKQPHSQNRGPNRNQGRKR